MENEVGTCATFAPTPLYMPPFAPLFTYFVPSFVPSFFQFGTIGNGKVLLTHERTECYKKVTKYPRLP